MSKWMVCCRKVCGMRLDLVKEGEAEGLWGLFTLGGKQQEVVVRTGRWLPRAMGNGFPKVVDVWPVCGYGDRPLHIFRSTCYVINISRKCILSPRWGTWAVPNHRTGCVPQALETLPLSSMENFFLMHLETSPPVPLLFAMAFLFQSEI